RDRHGLAVVVDLAVRLDVDPPRRPRLARGVGRVLFVDDLDVECPAARVPTPVELLLREGLRLRRDVRDHWRRVVRATEVTERTLYVDREELDVRRFPSRLPRARPALRLPLVAV